MIHTYWAIICKTVAPKECGTRHLLSYVGTGGSFTKVPHPIDFLCPECKQEHHYRTEDIHLYAGDGPPPDNFQELF
jgi:hypothetical protein